MQVYENNEPRKVEVVQQGGSPLPLYRALRGEPGAKDEWLKTHTFDYSELPRWMQSDCYNIAHRAFAMLNNRTQDDLPKLLLLDLFRRPSKAFCAGTRPSRYIRKHFEKMVKPVRPEFSPEAFENLGLGVSCSLYDLIHRNVERSRRGRVDDTCSMSVQGRRVAVEVLLTNFSPDQPGTYGDLARQCVRNIAHYVSTYYAVTELLPAEDVPLRDGFLRKLVMECNADLFENIISNPRVQLLLSYADAYRENAAFTAVISREQAFNNYAFVHVPLTKLIAEDARLVAGSLEVSHTEIPFQKVVESSSERNQRVGTLKDVLEGELGEDAAKGKDGRHLLKLCLRYGVSASRLGRLLHESSRNVPAIINQLHAESRSGKGEEPQAPVTSRVIDSGPTLSEKTILIHTLQRGQSHRHSFQSWLSTLSQPDQAQVHSALEDVQRGLDGKVRKITVRYLHSSASVYEIKLLGSPLRIYFCEIPDNRIILMKGGDKSSQQRDIKWVAREAQVYGSIKSGVFCDLPEYIPPERAEER